MPVNPNIAMGVRGIELQNPLAQYGQIAAIQNAQNQNALAQFQLGAAQRQDISQNALNDAYARNIDSKTGEINFAGVRNALAAQGAGSQIPGQLKIEREASTAKLTQQKAETDLVDAKLKQSRSFLDTLDPIANPVQAAQQYLSWHEANHRDPILGPALTARGIDPANSRAGIMAAIQKGPQALADAINASKLGNEKFMELNKPSNITINQGGQTQVLQKPGLGGPLTSAGIYADVALPAAVEAQKARIARAGASNITVSNEKTYGSKFAGLIADSDAAKLAAAEGAPAAAETADRILNLLSTGNVITGTGANVRLQMAKALNLAGGNDSEKIANTEVLLSSLAETTMGAIKSSNLGAGQGFTNADRDFLEKAKAGQITYDAKSLARLADLSRKAAEKSADTWNKRVNQIPKSALEGPGVSLEPVVVPPRKTASVMKIPSDAISALKSGAGTPEQFDAIFGAGSADRVLGKGK
jgi:hypothetical protein